MRLFATEGTAACTHTPATFFWAVTRTRLLVVNATLLTTIDDFGVVVEPVIVAVPLRLNCALPATFKAVPFVLAARTPVPVSAWPATPLPVPLFWPKTALQQALFALP